MEYKDTLVFIDDQIVKLQKDIENNPLKYIKNDRINLLKFELSLTYNISKHISDCWIHEGYIKQLIGTNKIEVSIKKHKTSYIYTLRNDKNKYLIIYNDFNVKVKRTKSNLYIYIYFFIEGDIIEFNDILSQIKYRFKYNLDISGLSVYTSLMQ